MTLKTKALGGRGEAVAAEYLKKRGYRLLAQNYRCLLYTSRKAHVIYMDPGGKPFAQAQAKQLTKHKNLIIICGHYEGIDERVRECLVDESISIGDYVLTGGEIPAMVVVDAVTLSLIHI